LDTHAENTVKFSCQRLDDPEQLAVEKLKSLVWRYFISYWNRRRISSA